MKLEENCVYYKEGDCNSSQKILTDGKCIGEGCQITKSLKNLLKEMDDRLYCDSECSRCKYSVKNGWMGKDHCYNCFELKIIQYSNWKRKGAEI